jgi:hypothetical protein
MNEIVQSQIKFLETKLALAGGDRKKEIEEKLKVLKERLNEEIVPIYKEDVVIEKSTEVVSTVDAGRRERIKAALAMQKKEIIEKLPDVVEVEKPKEEKSYEETVIEEVVDKLKDMEELPTGIQEEKEEPVELKFELEEKTVETEVKEIAADVIHEEPVVADQEIVAELEKEIAEEVEKDEPLPTGEEIEKEIDEEEEEILDEVEPKEEKVEEPVEEKIEGMEVPLVEPPVVETSTTTKKKTKRGRPKGSTTKKKKSPTRR